MSKKIIVGYDDSDAAQRALTFAIEQAQESDAEVIVAHVLEWSPYSFLTPEELEERHKRRGEELARAEKSINASLKDVMENSNIRINTVIKYGHVAKTLASIAKEMDATQIVIGRGGESELAARVFGSVAGSLAQASPVPCTIIP